MIKRLLKNNQAVLEVLRKIRALINNAVKWLNIKVLPHIPISSKWIGGPRGELRTFQEIELYVEKRKEKYPNSAFWHFFQGAINLRPPLLTLGNPVKEAQLFPKLTKTDEFFLRLPNAKVYTHHYCIITDDDLLVVPVSSVFSSQKHSHFAFFSFSLPQTKYLPGKTLIMNYGHNYFHAMIDALPTLYFAELAGYKLDEIDHFIFTGFSKEIYYAIFKRVGIPEHKIIVINHVVNYECEELLVGTVFERHGDWYKDYVVKKLGIQLTENKHHFPKRIYVSRAKAKMRKVINEDDVAEFLKGYGFEIVYNEGLSLEQQAEMYYNAEYIISAHGANLVNILYCKPGTHLCEIRYRKHTRYYSKVYFQMANAFKMKYYLLYCDEGRLSENYEGNEIEAESDMLVNLKHLEQIIKEMGLGSK